MKIAEESTKKTSKANIVATPSAPSSVPTSAPTFVLVVAYIISECSYDIYDRLDCSYS